MSAVYKEKAIVATSGCPGWSYVLGRVSAHKKQKFSEDKTKTEKNPSSPSGDRGNWLPLGMTTTDTVLNHKKKKCL